MLVSNLWKLRRGYIKCIDECKATRFGFHNELNKALQSTGITGNPAEWFLGKEPENINRNCIEKIWEQGTTPNGVFGVKCNLDLERFSVLKKIFDLPALASRPEIWETAFPNCKHIYMTRRNRVRLAASWWRAIVSGEWHREHGVKPPQHEIADLYKFEAIQHLIQESVMQEAAIEDFLSEGGIVPLTIVYEDFVLDYEGTVRKVLEFIGIPSNQAVIAPPALDKLADEVTEEWVQRYRRESQAGWENKRW